MAKIVASSISPSRTAFCTGNLARAFLERGEPQATQIAGRIGHQAEHQWRGPSRFFKESTFVLTLDNLPFAYDRDRLQPDEVARTR